jgi:hypothetical protein
MFFINAMVCQTFIEDPLAQGEPLGVSPTFGRSSADAAAQGDANGAEYYEHREVMGEILREVREELTVRGLVAQLPPLEVPPQ